MAGKFVSGSFPERKGAVLDLSNLPGAQPQTIPTASPSGTSGGESGGGGSVANYATQIKNLQVLASQADCNEKAGRLLAAANSKYVELRIATPANYIGAFDITPSLGLYEWGLADALFKRGLSLNGLKLICRSITANITAGGVMVQSLVFEIEAVGENGIPGNYPDGYPVPIVTTPVNPPPDSIFGEFGAFIVVYEGTFNGAFIEGDKTVLASISLAAGAHSSYDHTIAVLSTSKALVVGAPDATGSLTGYVVSIAGTVISGNAGVAYDTNSEVGIEIDKLDETHVAICYTKTGSYYANAYGAVSAISGTTSALGVPVLLDTQVAGVNGECGHFVSCCALTDTKCIYGWSEFETEDVDASIYCRVGTVTGSNVAVGNYYKIDGAFATGTGYPDIGQNLVSLTSSLAVMLHENPDDGEVYATAMTIAGTVITPGTPKQVSASGGSVVGHRQIAKISETTFVAALYNGADIEVRVGSVAGTVITLGAAITGISGSYPLIAVYTNKICLVYSDASSNLKRRTLTVSGTVLTDLADDTTNGEPYPNASTGGGICAL